MKVMDTLKKVTIEYLDDFSHQEIFDFVVDHLRRQGEEAKNVAGACVYRNYRGQTCAVGCLIPDELYDRELETDSPSNTSFWKVLNVNTPSSDRITLLVDLQLTHDQGRGFWEESLISIANYYNLTFEGL
jgi:hypothetical protein